MLDAGGWSQPNPSDTRALSSKLFLQGMEAGGLQIANVSGRDLLLGPEFYRALRDSLSVQFISANVLVDGEAWFRPYVVLRKQIGGRVLGIGVTGVTMKSRAAMEQWPDSLQLEFADPVQSATDMLEILRPEADIRILLAYLPMAALEDFAAEVPFGYDLMIGSMGDLRRETPLGPTPAVLSPGSRCKQMAWVNLRYQRPGEAELTAGNVLDLDTKVADDPEMAARVTDFLELLKPGGSSNQVRLSTESDPPLEGDAR